MLSVTGMLTIENVPRRFNHNFILTQYVLYDLFDCRLQSSPLVFYVRTEMLTLFVDESQEEDEEEIVIDESNKSDSKSQDDTQEDTSSEENESEDETQPTLPTHPTPVMRTYNEAPRMTSIPRNNHEMRQDDRMNRDRNNNPSVEMY